MPLGNGKAHWGVVLLAILGMDAWSPAAASPLTACPDPEPLALLENPQALRQGVEVLFDPQREYRIEDVVSPRLCAQFTPVEGTPSFGYERRGVWLRLRLPALERPEQWRLLIAHMSTDRLCAHWPLQGGGYSSQCAGIGDAKGLHGLSNAGWYFAVPAGLDAARPVLLYAQGSRGLRLPLQFGTADALLQHQYAQQIFIGAFYGVLIAAVLFGLALYAMQGNLLHLLFSAHFAAFALQLALREGHLAVWGLVGPNISALLIPMVCLVLVFGTPFYQRFLDTRRYTPMLHRLLWWALGLVVLATLSAVVQGPSRVLIPIAFPLWMFVLLAILFVRVRQGSRLAVYTLVAWSALSVTALHRGLELAGIPVVDPEIMRAFLYVGLLLCPGLLVLALVEHMRELARERDQANELALSSQRLALHRAQYDELTHLPNRAKLQEDLRERLAQSARSGRGLALVTMGLDHFSEINHSLGHRMGDAVLAETALRLQRALPDDALLARTGADLFAWTWDFAPGVPAAAEIQERCQELLKRVGAPLELGGPTQLSASFGAALYPGHADSAERLLHCSDTALRHAKRHRGQAVQVFEPAVQETASRYLELSRTLRQALEQHRLELHYQPVVALDSGALIGVEALARWQIEPGRYVPSEQFIPIAESGDLLPAFTEWSIDTACRQIGDWRARGVEVPAISVNLSAAQLRLSNIDERVLRRLHEAGVPGEALIIEVTEGALVENIESARDLLTRLRRHGVSVAMDDFGVGYASPHYLRVLPVNILKIDGSFLQDVPQDEEACSLLDGILSIGRSLRLEVVAECIERPEQRSHLLSRGVLAGQGFLFSAALPAADLEAWLKKRPARAA